jgi:hypothetical protein
MPALLLILAAAAHLLPEHLATWAGGTQAAWYYATSGAEAAALWALAFAAAPAVCAAPRATVIAARAVCVWGFFESVQRSACRLALPMDRPPPKMLPGQNICEVVTDLPLSLLSLAAALTLVVVSSMAKK